MLQRLREVDEIFGNPAVRLFFRKYGKALDTQIARNTITEARNASLEGALERAKPKKRKRVIPDPNEEFVTMAAVKRVRRGMAGMADVSDDDDDEDLLQSGNEDNETIEDCIEVENVDSGSNWSSDE